MLNHRGGRLGQPPDDAQGAVQIEQVVVRKFLAVELAGGDQIGPAAGQGVQRGPLMRILAVAEHRLPRQKQRDLGGKRLGLQSAGEKIGNGPIVPGRVRKGLGGQPAAQLERRAAVRGDLVENCGVLGRDGRYGREGVVLRRGADHRRAADVDLFDGLVPGHVSPRDGGLERIQVHHDQLEGQNAVLGQRSHVVGIVVPTENPSMHLRMEGFQSAVHHLVKSGVLRDVPDGDVFFGKVFSGAAGAEEFDAGRD